MTDRMSAKEYRAGAAGVPSEHDECKWLVQWAAARTFAGLRLSDLLIKVPNGAFHGIDRKAGAVIARKLREEGLQPGVYDYIVPVPIRPASGLWLEMKRTKDGRVSADQVKFRTRMELFGWRCEVAEGWIEAACIIDKYLGGGTRSES